METMRARVITFKSRFLQKVLSYNTKINDAETPNIQTTITAFMPKLKFKHTKPVLFLHMSNGNGSCLCRCSSPLLLADKLEELTSQLRSDRMLDQWQQINEISQRLSCNEDVILDDKYIDISDFKNVVINEVG